MSQRDVIILAFSSLMMATGGATLLMLLLWPKFRFDEGKERTEEEAAQPELPPLVPLRTAAEVAEVDEKTRWLATMAKAMDAPDGLKGERLNLDRPAGELLCDRPARPPHGSELWWSIRFAAMRKRPANWNGLTVAMSTIAPDWPAMVAEDEELTAAANLAEWEHLTETALTDTQEITREQLVRAMGGAK